MSEQLKMLAQKVEEAYLADEIDAYHYKVTLETINHLLLKGSVKVKVNHYAKAN